MPGKELSRNSKIEAMRARHAGAGEFRRGDEVIVEPTRGLPATGLVVQVFRHELWGPMAEVLVGGRVQRFVVERVSRPGRS